MASGADVNIFNNQKVSETYNQDKRDLVPVDKAFNGVWSMTSFVRRMKGWNTVIIYVL